VCIDVAVLDPDCALGGKSTRLTCLQYAHDCMGCKIQHRLEVSLCIKLVLVMPVLPGGCGVDDGVTASHQMLCYLMMTAPGWLRLVGEVVCL
jgi:hypothetical protein